MWGSRGAPPSSRSRPFTTTAPLYRSGEKAAPVPRKASFTRSSGRPVSGYGDGLVQVNVLDRVKQFDTLLHRPLKRLASADQSHSAGPLVDHRGADCLL